MKVSIDRDAILDIFNTKVEGRGKHIGALNILFGEELLIALFSKYLIETGRNVVRIAGTPTTGQVKGQRLDAWIASGRDNFDTLFQVEVKNWNINSWGGGVLENGEIDCVKQWGLISSQWLNQGDVKKVLIPMRKPIGYESLKAIPCLCLWVPFKKDGEVLPCIELPLVGEEFETLHIFSGSNFLKQLAPVFQVEMPDLIERKRLLDRIFPGRSD